MSCYLRTMVTKKTILSILSDINTDRNGADC